ncbi:RNA polymerase II assembly factor RTP1 [Tolypocladium ophioglossoides CBS 100239]|uniref:RNA polymerase II assembly factor RTP1 n=1 Tax=Tolypocladium ophioglossoides (strain CBS 100239) TaxID=1163406 RepID=A0A0L0NK40_TOLOC|nr:RNA polymerase II assembly factor RTP1 [Tolypocladium ophioglossoides CBS 100239]
MADSMSSKTSQPKIIEAIVEAAKKAFDPSPDSSGREARLTKYNDLIARTETWVLLPTLNALVKPNILPEWLREPLMQTLTSLPLKPDGVRATLEFVFSVHPSNNAAPADVRQPQKGGAGITHEAVAVATKLLSSVPSSMTPEAWFEGISGQLFSLFDGEAGPDLAKTAAQIVGFGILGKKRLGAPGAPGWNVFVQPLLESVNPSLRSELTRNIGTATGAADAEVVDLGQDRILVPARSLEKALCRLKFLILSNPSPGLCKRVLKPIILQLWAISSWINTQTAEQRECSTARSLVQTYLRLFGNIDSLSPLVENILCKGSVDTSKPMWRYRLDTEGRMDVAAWRGEEPQLETELSWGEIEHKSATLVDIITTSCSMEEVSAVFLHLLRRWIETAEKQCDKKVHIIPQDRDAESPVQDLVEVTLLQKLIEKSPEKLVSHFDQLLVVICQVLVADGRSTLGDDLIGVVLSLLNLVITAASFQKSDIKPHELQSIEEALDRIGSSDRPDVSTTARNLAMLLKYRDEVELPDESKSAPSARQVEDQKTYNLAINYITGGSDNPPPVVSEGLNLLSNLIVAESPVLDITAVAVLMSNLLKESEDYINLRVIKVFTQLANKHPKSTVQELVDNYLDPQEKMSTDARLRFGEALHQVIERLGETFSGDVAQQVCETLLSIAGRRGYRPKTMAKQAREARLRNMKKKGEDDTDEDEGLPAEEAITEEEKANSNMLAQIVRGWESKRGSEDVRIRTSSLSILGAALESNIGGIGPTIVSNGVDLCANVLAMERELEYGILRRAAVLVILGFVKALDSAKESNRPLGFGLTAESRTDIKRTLDYVAETDNDGLVQQHARDVVESLENWSMGSLLPGQGEATAPGLTRLAGLHVNPDGALVDASGRPRPRIEEVE